MDEIVNIPYINKSEYKHELILIQYYKKSSNELYVLTEKNGMFTIFETIGGKKVTTSKDKIKAIGLMNEIVDADK